MSPSLPPEGVELLTYLVPYPLLLAAIAMVIFEANDPPPDSPAPAVTVIADAATPRLVLASAAVAPPVPPNATANALIPVSVPPVIATALAFCVAIVPGTKLGSMLPNPKLILA